jgi:hypothetical protein
MAPNDEKIDFNWLSTLSSIFKGSAVVILIVSIIGIVMGIKELGDWGAFEGVGANLFLSGIAAILMVSLPFFTIAELIKVFIKIQSTKRKELLFSKIETDNTYSKPESKPKKTFDEWKKENPTKPIEDFYKELAKE